MDWQVIILTLGAALITGLTSIVGNILVVRSNLRKSVLENKEQKEKEFMSTRISTYESILAILSDINENLTEDDLSDIYLQLQDKWLSNYIYISVNTNRRLHVLTVRMESKNVKDVSSEAKFIREKIKEEIDEYYNINDKDDLNSKTRHSKFKYRRYKFK